MGLPSAKQINPYDDLDGIEARKNFFGKTQEQAEELFCDNPHYYQDDLMWMGPVAFRYYVIAAINFIQDEAVGGQPGFIDGFVGTLEFRLENEPEELAPIAEELAAISKYIIEHYDRVGDLPGTKEKAEKLTELLRKAFERQKEVLGDIPHSPEDCIDLRPRYFALCEAFSDLVE